MTQSEKAEQFAALHIKGNPLLLYNVWDAGSARAIAAAGARAIATSSWAVAAAHGYTDGEAIPLEYVEQIIRRFADITDLPVSLDFEGGYSDDDAALAENISRLLDTGVVGINFEDRKVKGTGLMDISRQAKRIRAIRSAASRKGVDLFINARSDVFFRPDRDHANDFGEAMERAKAYADAGASGLFLPGLIDAGLIGRICEEVVLPVNIMIMQDAAPVVELARLGVARISHGNIPYVQMMALLEQAAKSIFI